MEILDFTFFQLKTIERMDFKGDTMKNPSFFLIGVLISGCSIFNGSFDFGTVIGAGSDAYKAASLSDKDVQGMALQFAKYSDSTNKLAGGKYAQRLAAITSGYTNVDGLKLNYKVYVDDEVNAFALADGSIRVHTGLLDKMTDDEVRFVLGHEIGHVKHGHSKEKQRMAYATSALRKGVAASNSTVGYVASSQLGGLVEAVVNSQFSQSEEEESDDYGLELLKKRKRDPKAAVSALKKLAEISGGDRSFLSSHPDPEDRIERIEDQID